MKTPDSIIKSIGTCLTLDTCPGRAAEIKKLFESDEFDFEKWVQLGSDQFVLPAMHLQLARAGLAAVLPEDLSGHLANLTQMNRERNRRIMEEVKELATNLLAKNIEPVFLKGTAHLLLNLYNDPAERMIGDIDILVKDNDLFRAVEAVMEMGFQPLVKFNEAIHKDMKHYPRLVNYEYAAAVEIHREVVMDPYRKNFRAKEILSEKQEVGRMPGVFVPSDRHLIVHNMMNAQFNDKAYRNHIILVRQMYDLLKLTERLDPYPVMCGFAHYPKQFNVWLALNSELFDLPGLLKYDDNRALRSYLRKFRWLHKHPFIFSLVRVFSYFFWRLHRYISLPLKAVFDASERAGLRARLSDPHWYGMHFQSYVQYFKPNRRFKK